MLVMSRKVGEEINIAGGIKVRVCGVRGGKVRLGVTAPPEVEVDRLEVFERKLERKCRICGCTQGDCHQCIVKTGVPCYWVEDDLCSACADTEDAQIFDEMNREGLN